MIRTASLFLPLLLLELSAVAEKTDSEKYETVVVGRVVDEKRPADDPAAFTTVLKIKKPPAGTELHQLMEGVPGLRVRDSGPGGRKGLTLRGTDSHQMVIILDGIRLSSATGMGTDLSLLDPSHLEKAEVRRGGNSARFGSAALGGVLLLSTPRIRSRGRTSASVGYGSWNTVAARMSRSGSIFRRFRYLISGSYKQSEGDFIYRHPINHTEHTRQNNDSRTGELLLKLDYLLSDRWRFSMLDNLALGERGAPGILDSPCSTARQQNMRNLIAAKATRYDLLTEGSRLDLTIFHRLDGYHFHTPCSFNRPSHTRGHTLGAMARLVVQLGQVGQLDGGLEVQQELLQDRLPEEQRILEKVWLHRSNVDLFVSSKIRMLGGHLVAVPAVRVAMASSHGATVIPKAGLVAFPFLWTKNRLLSPFALAGNIGRSFRYPSFFELYVDMDSLRGNPDLSPEDALEGDIGLRWRSSIIAVEVAYYRRQIKNLILYAPVSPYLVEANNYSVVSSEGVEAALQLQPGWGLQLKAAYTFTHSSWDDPPLRLPGHPKHRLVARLAWEYPWAVGSKADWGIKLWSGITYEGAMPLDQHNNIELGQRVLLSAGGSGSWHWLTLTAEGRNLLDQRELLDSLGFPLPSARFLISLSAAL